MEARDLFSNSATIPPPYAATVSSSGQLVTTDTASGLPAVGRAIRLVGGLIGSATLMVYRGRRGDKRAEPDSELARLFENPYPGVSANQWRYDLAVSLEVTENAFIRKIRTVRGKVVALETLPYQYVNASVDVNGNKQYEVSTSRGWQRVPASDIIHIRGHTVQGGTWGVSRFQQHRDPVGSMLAAQKFEGSYFRNNAQPSLVVVFPQGITREQGMEWTDSWNAKYMGPENAGKAAPMGGGATVTPIPVSMRDAQFIEARQLGVEDIGRIMDVEPVLLGAAPGETSDDQAVDRFLAFQMPPRLARISDGLHADPELFPDRPDPYPAFEADPLIFASPLTRADVQHKQIQAGTLLPDEARADNGREPLPPIPSNPAATPGMVAQITPVGGAPTLPLPVPEED